MELRACANCDRTIGHLEQSPTWEGKTVCAACYARLIGAQKIPVLPAPLKPKVPWPFVAAVGLFVVAMVPIGLEFLAKFRDILEKMNQSGDMSMLALPGVGTNPITAMIGLILGIVNLVAFIVAWQGRAWGGVVSVATAAALVAMELCGLKVVGLNLTPMYISGLLIMMAGYACTLLPRAWAYYRECAAWRRDWAR